MTASRFIVIDDDAVSNLICKLTLEMVRGKVEVITFTNPQIGFDFIKSEYDEIKTPMKSTTLLLDINMPIMTGWEFLARFDQLDEGIKSCITIYILSSSVDPRDKDRTYSNKNVTDYLLKPLTSDVIKALL